MCFFEAIDDGGRTKFRQRMEQFETLWHSINLVDFRDRVLVRNEEFGVTEYNFASSEKLNLRVGEIFTYSGNNQVNLIVEGYPVQTAIAVYDVARGMIYPIEGKCRTPAISDEEWNIQTLGEGKKCRVFRPVYQHADMSKAYAATVK